MDFKSLIGLELEKAKKVLNDFGYNDIEEIKNSKEDEKCNKILVCAVKQTEIDITLVCVKFYIIGE